MQTAPERPRWSWRKKLLLQLLLLPLLVLAVEFGYRLLLTAQGHGYSANAARERAAEILSPMLETIPRTGATIPALVDTRPGKKENEQRLIAHPYWGFEDVRSIANMAMETQEYHDGTPPDEFRILILGGSVSGIFGMLGTTKLTEELEKSPRLAGRKVRVVCHGRGSFKQPQQLNLLNFMLAEGHRYDAVVCIDGFNEVALGNHNAWEGANPVYPDVFRWAHLAQGMDLGEEELDLLTTAWTMRREGQEVLRSATEHGCFQSAILGQRTIARLDSIRARWGKSQEEYARLLLGRDRDAAVRGPEWNRAGVAHGDLEQVLTTAAFSWSECSRSQQAICSTRGIAYLHVLQPTLHDEGSKVLTELEIKNDNADASWIEGVKAGYPKLRAAGLELQKAGVNFLDASMIFRDVGDTLYFDACHFRTQGNELLALAVAPALLAVLERAAPR
ncbi:MAG TPA: hypothetical protein VK843_06825 [Planctomycetota bacterium]|nr:hypothetical protein [Planctomycetota bacterium]